RGQRIALRGEERPDTVKRFALLFHGIRQTIVRVEQRAGRPAMLSDHERDDRTGQQPRQDRVLELGPDMHSYPPAPRMGNRGEQRDSLLRNPGPLNKAHGDADLGVVEYKMHRVALSYA